MTVLDDIKALRDLGWTWTRIAAHYRVSEREVRRWENGINAPSSYERGLEPPLALNYFNVLIINDTQYPSHDPALWEVTCQIARDAEVEEIIWDGDALDFEQLSSFQHNPYKITTAANDVEGFHRDLREPLIEATKETLKRERWNNGNHEFRYTRYAERNAPALGSLPAPREFLQLPSDIEFHEWGKAQGTWLGDSLLVSHGWAALKWSAATAKSNALDVGTVSVITGHTHRIGMFAHTILDPKTGTPQVQTSWEVGHMSDESKLPKAVQGYNDWQQVAGTIVRKERKGNAFHVDLIPIFGSKLDRAIANDREYKLDRVRA